MTGGGCGHHGDLDSFVAGNASPHRTPMSFEAVEREMEAAISRGVFPGAVLLVRDKAHAYYLRAFGAHTYEASATVMHEDTVFDVASLTKAFATSVAVMLLVRDARLRLDDRVTRFFHNFGIFGKTRITIRQLLSHSSGLVAHLPFYKELASIDRRGGRIHFLASPAAKAHVYQRLHEVPVDVPPGTQTVYSDLGYMLLGALIEEISGQTLDRFCHERIFRPCGARQARFIDLAQQRARHSEATAEIAPTERCPWRKKLLCGEVHDDNAWAMGGVAGHAGVFASARDLDAVLTVLKDSYAGSTGLVPSAIVREFWTRDATVSGSTWCLGWDTPSASGSSAGSSFSPHSVGHLGFTGCSVWLDLERDRHVILLSNRVYPSRDNDLIKAFRPHLHDTIAQALA